MMSCLETSTLTASGQISGESAARRAAYWLHLMMCRHCRRFWRQTRAVDRGSREVLDRLGEDAPQDLEERIADRIVRDKPL